jgi:hypothetical protein
MIALRFSDQQLLALLLGEEVDDAVQCLVGAVGVQGCQHQVTGFGEVDRILHTLAGTDLADQDHVRRLAQGVLECVLPRIGVGADFALRDQAADVRMHVLDRILDRDDMAARILIAIADHRRQRSRLARTGGTDHQHQSALLHHDLGQLLRQAELFEGRNLGVDRAQHPAHAVLLDEGIDAKPADARRGDREVALVAGLEVLDLAIVHQRAHDDRCRFGRQRLVHHRRHLAIELDRRRKSGGDEQVRCALLLHQREQLLDQLDGLFAIHGGLFIP